MKLSRRTVLHGGGAAIALPLLEAMLPRRAHAATPLRFVTFYTPNGFMQKEWLTANDALGPALAPLAPHRGDLNILRGIHQARPGNINHPAHALTCYDNYAKSGATTGSIDQEIAARIGTQTRFKSLQLGVRVLHSHTSYLRPGQGQPAENDPAKVFARLFGTGAPATAEAFDRARFARETVIDAVLPQYDGLRRTLGGADRQRLDAHFEAIREVERSLKFRPMATVDPAVCGKAAAPAAMDALANDNVPAVAKAQLDLAALALACDLTRVVNLQFSNPAGDLYFRWLTPPVTGGHHVVSHQSRNAAAYEQLVRINAWFAGQLAYLIDKLKASRGPEGALFDNAVILYWNGLADGASHTGTDAAYLLAGKAGGRLRTGRVLKFAGAARLNDLAVSLLNLVGAPATSFGQADWSKGPLPDLL
jgi:hypothetical protein